MAAFLKVGGGIAMGKVKNGLGIQVKDAELLATLTEGADEFEALHKRHKEAFDKVSLPLIRLPLFLCLPFEASEDSSPNSRFQRFDCKLLFLEASATSDRLASLRATTEISRRCRRTRWTLSTRKNSSSLSTTSCAVPDAGLDSSPEPRPPVCRFNTPPPCVV